MGEILLKRSQHLILISVLLLFVSSSLAINQRPMLNQTDAQNTFPSTFYLVEDEAEFPPVNPLGIKEDQNGNVHLWYLYIEPISGIQPINDVSLYYNILFKNGTNFLVQLLRESILDSKFQFLSTRSLAESADGTVYSIFIQTTFFSTNIIQFGWGPQKGFFTERVDYPSFVNLGDRIHGPIQNGDLTEFYVSTSTENNGRKALYKINFDSNADFVEPNLLFENLIFYPTLEFNFQNITLYDILDVTYANDTRFYIASLPVSSNKNELVIVEDYLNGTMDLYSHTNAFNVAPILEGIPFFGSILTDLIAPKLVSTENGKLFTFLFSFSESVQYNELVQWSPNGFTNPLGYLENNPFLINFFPAIASKGNEVRISALGFQISQDVFSVSVDVYRFDSTVNEITSVRRVTDNNFSFGIFLFAVDLKSDDLIGFAGTFYTPDYVIDDYNIANDTVGSIFIFSDNEIPDVKPNFVNVFLRQTDAEDTTRLDPRVVGLLVLLSIFAIIFVFSNYRKKRLELPDFVKYAGDSNSQNQKTSKQKMRSFFRSHFIYIKANKRRFQISIFVLLLPSLILITVFTGVMSHQANLLDSYDAQNPLNYDERINSLGGDFVWLRSFQDDEFSNNTILETDFEIPRQLSRTSLQTTGVYNTIERLSSTTVFELFEQREVSFRNDTGDLETFNYPVNREIAAIDPVWTPYIEANLVQGRLPTNASEVLVQDGWFVPQDPFNRDLSYGNIWTVGSEIELRGSLLDLFLNTSIPGLGQNISVVGIVESVDNLPFSEVVEWADTLSTTVSSLRVLDQFPFYTFPSLAADYLNSFSRMTISPRSLIDIRHNVKAFERDLIPELVESYEKLQSRTLQETGFPWLGNFSDTHAIEFLEGYFEASRSVLVEGSVILIPIIGLTLLLTYEALGIGKSSLEEE